MFTPEVENLSSVQPDEPYPLFVFRNKYDLLDLDAQEYSCPHSLQTADCMPIITARRSALCSRDMDPCVFSHLGDSFFGWPASRSRIRNIFSVVFGNVAFQGGVLWHGQTISAGFFRYHFLDCVFHLRGLWRCSFLSLSLRVTTGMNTSICEFSQIWGSMFRYVLD